MNGKIQPLAFGYAGAIVGAIVMFLLGILGNSGMYIGAVNMMQQWHMFFSLNIVGIIAGMIEAAIISFIFLYVFAWIYNKLI